MGLYCNWSQEWSFSVNRLGMALRRALKFGEKWALHLLSPGVYSYPPEDQKTNSGLAAIMPIA